LASRSPDCIIVLQVWCRAHTKKKKERNAVSGTLMVVERYTTHYTHNTHRVEGPCGRVLELVGAADGFGEGEQEVVVLLRAR
jgi:hypothetical protein